ncbi:MAG: hypothetical protein ABMA14_12905 [Hyphomonadaceae bacterium]
MTTKNRKSSKRHRLSGWARLWFVATALSWLGGLVDLAMSPIPLQWPPPFGDASLPSVRRLLWFFGPFVVAVVWIAVRWVWRGFRPPPDEASAPHLSAPQIVERGMRVAVKVGIVLFYLALAAAFVAVGIAISHLKGESKTFWDELFIGFQFIIAVGLVSLAWEEFTEPADD